MLDKNTYLIDSSAADLVATATGATKQIGPTLSNETWLIYTTLATGTTPKMVAAIQESNDDSNWTELTSMEITTAGEFYQTVFSNKKYRRAVLTISGTTPNFGRVMVGRVPTGRYNNY